MQSDAHLIRDILAGKRDKYAELVRRYEHVVHAAAWVILRDHHAAEDVAQDVFIKAYCRLGTLRATHTFGTWLLTIVRRAATDRARIKNRLVLVESVPDVPSPPVPAELDSASLLTELACLPLHEQQVLMLRYFNDLSVDCIAAFLGRPVGTITKQLSRAYIRLREALKENQ